MKLSLSDFGPEGPGKKPGDFFLRGRALVNDGVHGIHNRHVDGMRPRLTGRQFEAWFRLSHRPGQETTLLVLRGKEELTIRLRLP